MPKLIPVPRNPHLGRRSEGGTIWFRKSVGRLGQICVSTGTSDVKEARRIAAEIEVQLLRSEGKPGPVTFGEFGVEVFDAKELTWRPRTVKSARHHIFNVLKPYFGSFELDRITDESWGKFVVHRLAIKPGSYLGNTRKYMRLIMRRARNAGHTSKVLELAIPKRKSIEGKWLTKEQVESLLHEATPRLRLQIMMAYLMGMRKSEILEMTWDRVHFDRKTLYLGTEHTKTKRAREIAIHPDVLRLLKEKKLLSSTPFVFPLKDGRRGNQKSNESEWHRAQRKAQVFARFHDLRHSFISEMLLVRKAPILDVSLYVGSRAAELEETYIHPNAETTRHISRGMGVRLPFGTLQGSEE